MCTWSQARHATVKLEPPRDVVDPLMSLSPTSSFIPERPPPMSACILVARNFSSAPLLLFFFRLFFFRTSISHPLPCPFAPLDLSLFSRRPNLSRWPDFASPLAAVPFQLDLWASLWHPFLRSFFSQLSSRTNGSSRDCPSRLWHLPYSHSRPTMLSKPPPSPSPCASNPFSAPLCLAPPCPHSEAPHVGRHRTARELRFKTAVRGAKRRRRLAISLLTLKATRPISRFFSFSLRNIETRLDLKDL